MLGPGVRGFRFEAEARLGLVECSVWDLGLVLGFEGLGFRV